MTEHDGGPSGEPLKRPFLYVVVCAAGVASGVGRLIAAAQARGWEAGAIATPVAMGGFFDTAEVERLTGRPIRSAWRTPGDPRPFPPPDAVAVAPATFNTINKWAAGTADTLALATLCEAYGLGVPVAVLPCVAGTLAAHPAYQQSMARLRAMGVRFAEPDSGEAGSGEPASGGAASRDPAPGAQEGGERPDFGWERALDLLDAFPRPGGPRPAGSGMRYGPPS